MDKKPNPFAAALDYLMRQRRPRLTQAKLAEEIGLKQQQIGNILNGKSLGSVQTREKIAKFFGKSDDKFLKIGNNLIGSEGNKTETIDECVSEPTKPYTSEIDDLLNKARAVLESDTHWGGSLKSNILSFHTGFESDKAKLPMDHGEKHKAG